MRLVLLGAPGSGKGTQGQRIVVKYGIPQIATGDILRDEMAAGTSIGKVAQEYVSRGALVPDSAMIEIMEKRLERGDVASGFVLDGFPRSIPQAEGLDRHLSKTGKALNAVIKLDVPRKVLVERMLGRRVCPQCHAVYHIVARPTKEEGICDRCGAGVVERADDDEETFHRRLNVYDATTAPLINYYNRKGVLIVVDGNRSFAEVSSTIDEALDGRMANGR